MSRISVSKSKDYLEREGKPFFYMADTIWAAFANVPIEEWEEYLDYRIKQGFTVLQISVLPISHDTSENVLGISAFKTNAEGKLNFFEINEAYFERACKMLDMAWERGLVPALAPLWVNYVKDTWAADKVPECVMPLDAVHPYLEYVIPKFEKYEPIYLASGDTGFESELVIEYYRVVLETIKRIDPKAITTMHLAPNQQLPDLFIQSENLDFYMYQSGHKIEEQHFPYKLAEYFINLPVKRPIVNGEPCYEGHGHAYKYARFNEFDIRKATWQSLLSGAKAGITYGAHGIWSWHKKGMSFTSEFWSKIPHEWRTALKYKGAWDVSFARWIFESYQLFDIEPMKIIKNDTEEIRLSASRDMHKIAIYVPYDIDVKLDMDVSGYDLTLVVLDEKRIAKPDVESRDGLSIIKMHEFNSDALIICVKNR